MTLATALWLSGRDVAADFGMTVGAAGNAGPLVVGGWDAPDEDWPRAAIPGLAGAYQTSTDPVIGPGTRTVSGIINAPTVAARLAFEDDLKAWTFARLIELKWTDRITQIIYGHRRSLRITPTAPDFISLTSRVELAIECLDPFAYEVGGLATPIAFGSVRTGIPIGTAPSSPRTLITNLTGSTVSTRTLTYRNAAGDVVQAMTLAGNLLNGEALDIQHAPEGQTITKVSTTGVRSSARSYLTAGTYFAIRHSDGNYGQSVYPTLEVSTAEQGLCYCARAFQ